MNPVYGSSTVQQGGLFAYGKMRVRADFVLDAIASIGLSSSDISRNDITDLSSSFRNKSVSGNDALIGLGLSRAFETSNLSITPIARVTWQVVTQSGVDGTAKMSNNTFAYAGISAEARSGQTLGTVNLSLKVQF